MTGEKRYYINPVFIVRLDDFCTKIAQRSASSIFMFV